MDGAGVVIQIAGFDPIRDEGIAFADRLKDKGVPVEMHVYKDLPHVCPSIFTEFSQTKKHYARQDAFLKKLLSQ